MKRTSAIALLFILAMSMLVYADTYALMQEVAREEAATARQGLSAKLAAADRASLRSRIVRIDANAIIQSVSGGGVTSQTPREMPLTKRGKLRLNFFDDIGIDIDSVTHIPKVITADTSERYYIGSSSLVAPMGVSQPAMMVVDGSNVTIFDAVLNNGRVYKIFPLNPTNAASAQHIVMEVDPTRQEAKTAFGFHEPTWTEEDKQRIRDSFAEIQANPHERYEEIKTYLVGTGYSDEVKEQILARQRLRLGLDLKELGDKIND